MTVDIMMPFYGRVDHFQQAVRSVLDQDDDRWRLVIVDDLYPDLAAGQWARAIGDPRVEYLRNESNLGITGNFLRCVELAEAERIVIMGSDDRMEPGYVRRIHELAEQFPTAAMIQPGVRVIDADGDRVQPLADRVKSWCRPRGSSPQLLEGEDLAQSLLRGNWAYFPSICWRTDELRQHPFREDLRVVQDLALMLELIDAGGQLALDDQVTFVYRRHSESLSAITGPDGSKFVEERTVFTSAIALSRRHGWRRSARAARYRITSRMHAVSAIPAAIGTGDLRGLLSLVRHALGR